MTRFTLLLTAFVVLAGVLAACAAPAAAPTAQAPSGPQGPGMGQSVGMGPGQGAATGMGQGMSQGASNGMGMGMGTAPGAGMGDTGAWMDDDGDMMGDDERMMDDEAMVWGQPVTAPGGVYRDISVDDLQAMLAQEDFLLVNVHIPFAGNIPGTDLSIPYNRIAAQAGQLPTDKDAAIVVYCRSGAMSTAAAQTLVQMGYTRVYNLRGGFNAWQAAGLPLDMNP